MDKKRIRCKRNDTETRRERKQKLLYSKKIEKRKTSWRTNKIKKGKPNVKDKKKAYVKKKQSKEKKSQGPRLCHGKPT